MGQGVAGCSPVAVLAPLPRLMMSQGQSAAPASPRQYRPHADRPANRGGTMRHSLCPHSAAGQARCSHRLQASLAAAACRTRSPLVSAACTVTRRTPRHLSRENASAHDLHAGVSLLLLRQRLKPARRAVQRRRGATGTQRTAEASYARQHARQPRFFAHDVLISLCVSSCVRKPALREFVRSPVPASGMHVRSSCTDFPEPGDANGLVVATPTFNTPWVARLTHLRTKPRRQWHVPPRVGSRLLRVPGSYSGGASKSSAVCDWRRRPSCVSK